MLKDTNVMYYVLYILRENLSTYKEVSFCLQEAFSFISIYIYIYIYIYITKRTHFVFKMLTWYIYILIIYMFIHIYIYVLHTYKCALFKTICSFGYHHNGFMATAALGHTHVWLYAADIQEAKECSSYHKNEEHKKHERRMCCSRNTSCTWQDHGRCKSCAQVMTQSHCGDNQKSSLFS